MSYWKNDKELFALAKGELFTALVGDILDKLGYLHQFLPAQLKPLDPGMVIIGRAMTVVEADVYEEVVAGSNNPIMKKPFGVTGSSHNYALWGGLMSLRAMYLKSAGVVVNGYTRDTNEMLELGFPTFSMGTYAQDQGPRGKVIDYRVPIEWHGIRIHPGDIIYGDRDGVLVIPKAIEVEAFSGAIEKSRAEKMVAKALKEGMSTVEAFTKFGVM
jgi:regulator of RNase E activity RraA